jgi:hypothetical protein
MKKVIILGWALSMVLSVVFIAGTIGSGSAYAASPQISYINRKSHKVAHRTKYYTERGYHKTKRGTQTAYYKTKHGTKVGYAKTKHRTKRTYHKTAETVRQ